MVEVFAGIVLYAQAGDLAGAARLIAEVFDVRPSLARRGAQAFEIHTTCRALYTAESGELATKAQAVTRALKTLPPRWQPLVEWSQHHRGELAHDTDKIPEIMTFLRWAAAYAGAA
jgi:hypothetical protein